MVKIDNPFALNAPEVLMVSRVTIESLGVRPHLVLDQAVEAGSPKTMTPVEAFRKSSQYARRLFADFE